MDLLAGVETNVIEDMAKTFGLLIVITLVISYELLKIMRFVGIPNFIVSYVTGFIILVVGYFIFIILESFGFMAF